ncbi:hypothetical protein F5Y12DRAFT_329413 [Xylaria sp. FL1777]|nr:hypothetical protein F5Y12DRAFT_329413 [Xylaria sp. FL1777]
MLHTNCMVALLNALTVGAKKCSWKREVVPETLRDLEIFIGFTTWLRTSVPNFGILVKPLQDRKAQLLKRARSGPSSGSSTARNKGAGKTWATSVAFTYPTESKRKAIDVEIYHVNEEVID